MTDKTKAIEKQMRTFQNNLRLLHESLDEAAEAANIDAVKSLQGNITATEAMIASCERRLVKAQQEVTEAEKAEIRASNLQAVNRVEQELKVAVSIAEQIEATLGTFVKHLTDIHAHGAAARLAAAELVNQLPLRERERHWHLLQAASFSDTSLGAFIDQALNKAGVFRKLAPHLSIQFMARDLPGIAEGVGVRATKLPAALSRLAEQVNASL